MKRTVLALGILLACAAAPATAAPILFRATLTGPGEEPPNASPGIGKAKVNIDPVAHTLSLKVWFSDLLGPVTASHIHVINGPGDANMTDTLGPVATTTPSFTGFPAGVTFGTYTRTLDTTLASTYRAGFITASGGTIGQAEAELFDAILEGRAYLNIHSTVFPAGEIRGFLQAQAPEPGTLALFALGAAGLIRRRLRRR